MQTIGQPGTVQGFIDKMKEHKLTGSGKKYEQSPWATGMGQGKGCRQADRQVGRQLQIQSQVQVQGHRIQDSGNRMQGSEAGQQWHKATLTTLAGNEWKWASL